MIRNTVKQAQAVFRALGESGGAEHALQVAGGPALHHSRFAAEDRRLLDRAVERALGNGRQPGGVVVIGTQTLEQSLDIDADLLLTDLCPVDVLLQRIGRLHRHPDTVRPERHRVARCVVLTPEEGLEAGLDGGLLRYGLGASRDGGGVYRDLLVLEATRRLVVEHPVWDIPSTQPDVGGACDPPAPTAGLGRRAWGSVARKRTEILRLRRLRTADGPRPSARPQYGVRR